MAIPSGTEAARPFVPAKDFATSRAFYEALGFEKLLDVIRIEEPELVVVGLPLTLRGDHGEQAVATTAFVDKLRVAIDVPVETFDERFTSVLAGGDDARAAAHLLSGYLTWRERS